MTLAPLAAEIPKPTGDHVNDYADLLSATAEADLEEMLRTTEADTSIEIVVVTRDVLDGIGIEGYAEELFNAWGIGQKGKDNGVLVLIAPHIRRIRIEVGYGLEGVLPDGVAGEIIRTEFTPSFSTNDYETGIKRGVARVNAIVRRGERVPAPEPARAPWRVSPEDDAAGAEALYLLVLVFAVGCYVVGRAITEANRLRVVQGAVCAGVGVTAFLLVTATGPLWWFLLTGIGVAAFRAGVRRLDVISAAVEKAGSYPDPSQSDTHGNSYIDTTARSSSSFGGGRGTSSGGRRGGSFGGGRSGGGGASGRW